MGKASSENNKTPTRSVNPVHWDRITEHPDERTNREEIEKGMAVSERTYASDMDLGSPIRPAFRFYEKLSYNACFRNRHQRNGVKIAP